MNTAIWANLFWKEWREHQWKLAALTAILLGTFFAIWASDWREGAISAAWIILFFYTPLAALFIGMGLASGEHARGTVVCLQRLPVTPRPVAIVKLLVGLAAVIAPGLILIAVCWLIQTLIGGDDPFHESKGLPSFLGSGIWWVETSVIFTVASASLLIWVIAISVNCTTELRAGAFALIVVIALWTFFFLIVHTTRPNYDFEWQSAREKHVAILTAAMGPLPGGGALLAMAPQRDLPMAATTIAWCLFCVMHSVLIGWWVLRYASVVPAAKRVTNAATQPSTGQAWLRPPHRGRVEAILWKQFREAAPIIAGVVVLAVGWTLLIWLNEGSSYQMNHWLGVLVGMTTLCGFLAALLVGVGGFQDDLDTGTSTFWRSRPIPPNLFYWLKYAGGLVALAIVFGGTLALAYELKTPELHFESRYIVPGIIVFWLTYASAVTVACLVRNAIYAGILAILPAGYGMVVAFSDEFPFPLEARVALLLIASVAVSLLGWLSMRNDWAIGR